MDEGKNRLVLLVDDDEMSRDIFEILLQGIGVSAEKAESGAEALVLVQKKKYDLIFIDHMMPEMDGVETLHNMRKLPQNKNQDTPVIALTANVKVNANAYYLSEGFNGYLAKPVRPEELEETICSLLASKNENAFDLSSEKEEEVLPAVEDFNWEYALSYNLNLENLKRLLKDFTGKLPRQIEEFSNFEFDVLEEDADLGGLLKEYRIKVHALKSNLKSFGNTKLSDCALGLETAAKNEDLAAVLAENPAFCQKLRKCYEQLSVLVRDFL